MLNRKQIFDDMVWSCRYINFNIIAACSKEMEPVENLKAVNTTGWNDLSLITPKIGQHILYEGNLCPAFGVYIGDNDVRLNDGTLDKFDRWQPK